MKKFSILPITLLLAGLLVVSSGALAQADKTTQTKKSAQTVATGFFISDGGFLVSSEHVIRGRQYLYALMPDRRLLPAVLVKVDAQNDIALLKVSAMTPFLYLSHSSGVPPGMDVVTIGYPQVEFLGLSPKITRGIVNSSSGLKDDKGSFQFSAEIQKGNSGGPLIGPGGTVVGIVRAKLDASKMAKLGQDTPQNVNFAVKSARLIQFLQGTAGIPFTRPLNAETEIRPIRIYSEAIEAIVPIIARDEPFQK
jgi:serine protease Do